MDRSPASARTSGLGLVGVPSSCMGVRVCLPPLGTPGSLLLTVPHRRRPGFFHSAVLACWVFPGNGPERPQDPGLWYGPGAHLRACGAPTRCGRAWLPAVSHRCPLPAPPPVSVLCGGRPAFGAAARPVTSTCDREGWDRPVPGEKRPVAGAGLHGASAASGRLSVQGRVQALVQVEMKGVTSSPHVDSDVESHYRTKPAPFSLLRC